MKKSSICFVLTLIWLIACNKPPVTPPATPPPSGHATVVGKWTIDTVTTYFYDTAGYKGENIYPGKPYYYFQFNADSSWVETLDPNAIPDQGINGTYTFSSDSAFTLINPVAAAPSVRTACKLVSLSNSSFVFYKIKPTSFNGNDSGYIQYWFKLSK